MYWVYIWNKVAISCRWLNLLRKYFFFVPVNMTCKLPKITTDDKFVQTDDECVQTYDKYLKTRQGMYKNDNNCCKNIAF